MDNFVFTDVCPVKQTLVYNVDTSHTVKFLSSCATLAHNVDMSHPNSKIAEQLCMAYGFQQAPVDHRCWLG